MQNDLYLIVVGLLLLVLGASNMRSNIKNKEIHTFPSKVNNTFALIGGGIVFLLIGIIKLLK